MNEALSGADFSADRRYRYRLWRTWDPSRPPLLFVMLNPSTADGNRNDPTIARCILRAQRLGYGGLEVVNLFAYCATEPADMKAHHDPIGRDNEAVIAEAAARAGKIIGGWGQHGAHLNRGRNVALRLKELGHTLYHLGVTKDGHPKHPLYVPYDVLPQEFNIHP